MNKIDVSPEPEDEPQQETGEVCAAVPVSEVELEIVLRGRPFAGKTEVMQIIADALGSHGIKVECYMGKRRKRITPGRIRELSGNYDSRRVAIFEEWGTRIPKYPQNAAGQAAANHSAPQHDK